jgi:hypothetical protein
VFSNCAALKSAPFFDLSSCTNTSSMFNACSSLTDVPLYNLSKVTNAGTMFSNCYSLVNIPFFDLSSVTNGTSMFQNVSAKILPPFNLGSLLTGNNMFSGCQELTSIPLLDLHSLTDGTGMFQNCKAASTIATLNLSSLITGTNMFFGNVIITSVPLFVGSLSNLTNGTNMFGGCSNLTSLPAFNLSSLTNGTNMFTDCNALQTIPSYNLGNLTTTATMFQNCYSNSKFLPINLKNTFSLANNRLSKTALETMFTNLFPNVAAKTVTITGNWGADPIISKATTGTTSGSLILTQTNTSSLTVGMRVSGTGIDTAVAVNLLIGSNTITRTAHGIPNGRLVYLMTIVTTTGLTTKTPYYVVNATPNDFQVSLTNGGAPITFTGANGTGTLFYASYITAINPNVNFTIDIPASATGSITATARLLDTSLAIGKGWTVTG